MQNRKLKYKNIKRVAFLGGAAWKKSDKTYIDAYETAKLLTENGYEIINGGGPGVMLASTLGSKDGGGDVVAVTYHPNKVKRHYEGVDEKNVFDHEVVTLDYFDRTKVMLQTTDAHIIFRGSIGTMSELGMTWISSWIHFPHTKPIVLFGKFWRNYINFMKKYMLLEHNEDSIIKICNTPREVLKYLNSFK